MMPFDSKSHVAGFTAPLFDESAASAAAAPSEHVAKTGTVVTPDDLVGWRSRANMVSKEFARSLLRDFRVMRLTADELGAFLLINVYASTGQPLTSDIRLSARQVNDNPKHWGECVSRLIECDPPLVIVHEDRLLPQPFMSANGAVIDADLSEKRSRAASKRWAARGLTPDREPVAVSGPHIPVPPEAQLGLMGVEAEPPTDVTPSGKKVPACPYSDIMEIFHEVCVDLNRIRSPEVWAKTRRDKLRSRWLEYPSLAWWKDYFTKIQESDFLCGRGQGTWKADFDWILEPRNLSKIIEDSYANRGRVRRTLFNQAGARPVGSYGESDVPAWLSGQ